jgi:hypothetical protein
LRFHIEQQFTKGFTWENYGTVWHVDHRIPCIFAKDEETLRALFQYTNLQPLLIKDNLSKGSSFDLKEAEEFLAGLKF